MFHKCMHMRVSGLHIAWDNSEMKGDTYSDRRRTSSTPFTRGRLRGFQPVVEDEVWSSGSLSLQDSSVLFRTLQDSLVLSWLLSLLPSQLAALSRPTPHQAGQPIRGRLSILNPPSPVQSPGLQKHTTSHTMSWTWICGLWFMKPYIHVKLPFTNILRLYIVSDWHYIFLTKLRS